MISYDLHVCLSKFHFSNPNYVSIFHRSHASFTPLPKYLLWFDRNDIWWRVKLWSSILSRFLQPPATCCLRFTYSSQHRSSDSLVNIAMVTGWLASVQFPAVQDFFSTPQRADQHWNPFSLLPNGYRGLFSHGEKLQWRVAELSPPSSAKFKKSGATPPLFHMSSWHNA
jgi:hypothetical protein